ncbi:MAG TPA: ZIP family metal transporter [Chroococcales cyanobacterium]
MSHTWVMALASVSLVGLISLMGVIAIPVKPSTLKTVTSYLVALATGAMLGNAVVHLMPESFEYVESGKMSSFTVSLLVLLGMSIFFVFEKILNIRCHHGGVHHDDDDDCPTEAESTGNRLVNGHIQPLGHMSLLSHGVDNLCDGILIGAMFLVSPATGLATTLAIVMHEIPMEFGEFGVLVHSGFSRLGAIVINFSSAVVAFIGTLSILLLGSHVKALPMVLTPIGCGLVLYITAAGLIPRLQKEVDPKQSVKQFLIMAVGIAIMVAVKAHEQGLL